MINLKKFALVVSILSALSLPTQAFAEFLFFDDFEDGNADGWTSATNGGVSKDGVEIHNSSLMAFAAHIATAPGFLAVTNENSLAHDFAYSANSQLSFDMHAIATSADDGFGRIVNGKAGVTVTFLNAFNVALGSAGLYFSTNPTLLGANESLIDSVQHHYAATMGSFASLAGVGAGASIDKVNLTFRALGQFVPNASATATVWLDNVAIQQPIPEPSTWLMMVAGVLVVVRTCRNVSRRPLVMDAIDGTRHRITCSAHRVRARLTWPLHSGSRRSRPATACTSARSPI